MSSPTLAHRLNHDCQCMTLDRVRLARELGAQGDPLEMGGLLRTHPHLFANSAVYVARDDLSRMAATIAAVERVVALPAWQAQAAARHGVAVESVSAARGVFFGYDFHPGAGGPQLIEINTNAGGGLLNVALREAQIACCNVVGDPGAVDAAGLVAMFREEWRLAHGSMPLMRVAIVDDAPATQYLWPEFERFVRLFAAHGIDARIVDPEEMYVADGHLYAGDWAVDLVYNRLTDFLLDDPRHAALAEAYRRGYAMVTPHPRAWALFADKRNLVTLTDPSALRELGIDEETIATLLAGIPETRLLDVSNADAFWAERKNWFFKPAGGHGSKAAYRGDKLTRGKWQEILAGEPYVAQRIVPPGERRLQVKDETVALKMDLRNYVYDGRVQLVSARLYQGQTTNFRTEGGGFAAVFAVP